MSETSSSTADAAAIGAMPGRVTVHIWSSVRSVKDCEDCSSAPAGAKKWQAQVTYVCWCDDVIAVIAPESLRCFSCHRACTGRPCTMPHHQPAVEAQRSVDDDLALGGAHDRWKPARLPRVHEKEDGVMFLDKLSELVDAC